MNSCYIEAKGLIYKAEWYPDRVRVALIINWQLPVEKKQVKDKTAKDKENKK